MSNNNTGLRFRRFPFSIGSSAVKYHQQANHGSKIYFKADETLAAQQSDTFVQTAFKTVSKVLASGGDIITAPVVWFKDMLSNWHIYMITIAIILLCLLVAYCSVNHYLTRKGSKIRSPFDFFNLAALLNDHVGEHKRKPLDTAISSSLSGVVTTAGNLKV